MTDFLRTRHGSGLVVTVLLCLLFFAADRMGQALLTPLPRSWLIGTLVLGVPIGCLVALAATSPIGIRPLRRLALYVLLTVLGTGFATLGKALYLFVMFGGPLAQSVETWPVVGGESGSVEAYSASLDRQVTIGATPEAVGLAGLGKCVPVAVERNAWGDVKQASVQPTVGPESIRTCDMAQFMNEARARRN